MGKRGPVPKRSDQRRRRNAESKPQKAPASKTAPIAPAAKTHWHPIAKTWFKALRDSGQSKFYEPSDWATALLIAESISRDLKPQVVGIHEETGKPVLATIPMKGASLSAYLKAMSLLLVTEGDRRRVQLELERPPAAGAAAAGSDVADMAAYRDRLGG